MVICHDIKIEKWVVLLGENHIFCKTVNIDLRAIHSIPFERFICGIQCIILAAIEEASVWIEKHSKQKMKNVKK